MNRRQRRTHVSLWALLFLAFAGLFLAFFLSRRGGI